MRVMRRNNVREGLLRTNFAHNEGRETPGPDSFSKNEIMPYAWMKNPCIKVLMLFAEFDSGIQIKSKEMSLI